MATWHEVAEWLWRFFPEASLSQPSPDKLTGTLRGTTRSLVVEVSIPPEDILPRRLMAWARVIRPDGELGREWSTDLGSIAAMLRAAQRQWQLQPGRYLLVARTYLPHCPEASRHHVSIDYPDDFAPPIHRWEMTDAEGIAMCEAFLAEEEAWMPLLDYLQERGIGRGIWW